MKRTVVTALVGIAVAASLWGLAAKSAPEPRVFIPDPAAAGAATLDGSIWVVEGASYNARLAMIDDRERQAYLKDTAGTDTDPFVSSAVGSKGFLTFLLSLKNDSKGWLVFQPQTCRLITKTKEIRLPLDIPTIEAAYGSVQREMPPAYDAARGALYDGEQILEAGDSSSGLLVYRGVDPRTKSFVIEVRLTTPEGEIEEFAVRYVREKKKKKKGDS